MASSLNKLTLIGNVGKDPDIRYSQDGNKVASFSVATSEVWKDKATGERKDNTQWHRVVIFNENLADVVEKYVKKGTKLYVEGSLQYRKYTPQDGVERMISELVINKFRGELQLLDSAKKDDVVGYNYEDLDSANTTKKSDSHSSGNASKALDLDDDIPF